MTGVANYCEQLCRGGQVELHLNGLVGVEDVVRFKFTTSGSVEGAECGVLSSAPVSLDPLA